MKGEVDDVRNEAITDKSLRTGEGMLTDNLESTLFRRGYLQHDRHCQFVPVIRFMISYCRYRKRAKMQDNNTEVKINNGFETEIVRACQEGEGRSVRALFGDIEL